MYKTLDLEEQYHKALDVYEEMKPIIKLLHLFQYSVDLDPAQEHYWMEV